MDLIPTLKPPNCALCLKSFLISGYFVGYSYHNGTKRPYLLQCGHSACDKCLHNQLASSNEVTCNVCKEVSYVPKNFTATDLAQYFPINFFLIGLWTLNSSSAKANELDSQINYSKPRNSGKKDKIKAVMCNECLDKQAVFHCQVCKVPYCEPCFKTVHLAVRALRGHSKVPLLEDYLNIEPEVPIVCSVHPTEKLQFFCLICTVPACANCLVENHQGHKIDLLENVHENYEDEFIDRYVKVTNVLQRLKASQKKAELTLRSNASSTAPLNKTHQQIAELFTLLHGKLTILQNAQHMKVNAADDVFQLESILGTLTEFINTTESLLVSTKGLLTDAKLKKPKNFIAVIDNLKKKEGIPCFFLTDGAPPPPPTFTINQEVIDSLNKVCDIDVPGASKYKLVTEADLPPDYEVVKMNEVSREEILTMISNSCSTSSVATPPSSANSDTFSDKVVLPGIMSRSSSPLSVSSGRSLVSLRSSMTPREINYLDELSVGCQVRVTICHLVSPSDFYVQRECAVKKIADFQASLARYTLGGQKPPNKMSRGQIYLVRYEKDSKWYRARILEVIDDNTFKVVYIDYGNNELVHRSRIRTLPKNAMNMPVLAIRCKLNNCVPIGSTEWDPQAVALVTQIIDNDYVSMVVKDKTPISHIVDLFKFTDSCTINIQQALIFMELACCAAECEVKRLPSLTFTPGEMKLPKLKTDFGTCIDAHVSHVVSPSEFYIQNMNSGRHLIKMAGDLNRTCNNINDSRYNVFDPRKGMYVVARYSRDRKWYRGRITGCLKNRLMRVFFIDFGAEEDVSWADVKVMHNRFSKIAPQAIRCCLSDLKPPEGESTWSQEACKFFQHIVFAQRMRAVVERVFEDNSLSIVLYKNTATVDICINAYLVQEGKAVSTGINSTLVENPIVAVASTSSIESINIASTVKKSKPPTPPSSVEEEQPITEEGLILSSAVKGPNESICYPVIIKRLLNPGEFYFTFFCLNDALLSLHCDLLRHYNSANNEPKDDWDADSPCAVKHNNKWYRGLLTAKEPEGMFVANLVDKGFDVTVDNTCLSPLHEKFKVMRDGVFKCHLGGIEPVLSTGWSSSSVNEMEDFVTNHKEMLYISNMGPLKDSSMPVQLFARIEKSVDPMEPVVVEWKSFNHYLRFIGLAKSDGTVEWDCDGNVLNKAVLEKNILVKQDMEKVLSRKFCEITVDVPNSASEEVDEIEELAVASPPQVISIPKAWIPAEPLKHLNFIALGTYVDEEANIYLHDFHESSSTLEQISKALSMKYEGTLPKPCDATLKVGDICIARFHSDKKWYRGVVVKAPEDFDEYEVLYVDYGNTEVCKLLDLRKVPVAVEIPIQAVKCSFIDIEPTNPEGKYSETEIEFIHYELLDKNLQIEVEPLTKKPGQYAIKKVILPDGRNFISYLVKEGIAKYKSQRCKLEEIASIDESIDPAAESSKAEQGDPEVSEKEDDVEEAEEEDERSADLKSPLGLLDGEKSSSAVMDWFTIAEKELSEKNISNDSETLSHITSPSNMGGKYIEGNTDDDMDDLIPDEEAPQLVHWSVVSSVENSQNDSLNYKELHIPPSVDILLVEVTAFHSPTQLVLHVSDVEEDLELLEKIGEFKKLSDRIQEEAPQQPLLQEPYKYKVCTAQFSSDLQWYRGFVLDVTDAGLLIQFVDYGNVEVQSPSNIRELKDEWAELPVMGLLCELYNISISKEVHYQQILANVTEILESGGHLRAVIKERTPRLKVDLYIGDTLAYEELIENKLLLIQS